MGVGGVVGGANTGKHGSRAGRLPHQAWGMPGVGHARQGGGVGQAHDDVAPGARHTAPGGGHVADSPDARAATPTDAPTPTDALGARDAADRSPRRRWPWVIGLIIGVPTIWGAWLAVDALEARAELSSAAALVGTLQDQILDGDRTGAAATLETLQAYARSARRASTGPHWSAAAVVPWVGPNIQAVQTVADVVDDLATEALPALMDATQIVDPATMAPVDGRVDIAALEEAAPAVVSADAVVADALARLDAVQIDHLWQDVAEPLLQVRDKVADVASSTATAARAVQLIPAMLGADGPRTYLLLVQNNAEVRALGGIPGSVSLLRAEDGGVQILETRNGGSLGDLPEPVVPLTDTEMSLFGEDLAADMRDVTFTPDFPRAAAIAAAIWVQEVGGEVDGVVSVDPGALALLLDAIGPVPLAPGATSDAVGGELTAQNAVALLLNTVYLYEPEPAQQDAFFADTAEATLGALLAGQGQGAPAIDALAEAARQGRLMVWSAHADEQALLADTVLSGRLRGDLGESPVVGVFFNDGSRAKMSYYLETNIDVGPARCRPDGSRLVDLTVTLTNTAPADVATLPSYVTGVGDAVPEGEVRTNVLIYAPTDGWVEDVQVVGEEPGVTSQIHEGLAVVGRTTQLAPGGSVTLQAQVVAGPQLPGPVVLRSTPVADGHNAVGVTLCP